jgi:hypothetical protein
MRESGGRRQYFPAGWRTVTIAIRNKKTAALGGHTDWKYQVKEIQFKK